MTNAEFIKKVAEKGDYTQKAAKEFFAIAEEVLRDEYIAKREDVKVMDVTLTVVDTAARKGVNPKTGEPANYPASKKIKVRPSASLKQLVKAL